MGARMAVSLAMATAAVAEACTLMLFSNKAVDRSIFKCQCVL